MDKIILLDTKESHAKAHPENAIIVKPWKGDPSDRELISLIPFLEYVAFMGIEDVRGAIKSYDGKHIPTEFAEREARMRAEIAKQVAASGSTKKKSSLGKWASNIGGQRQIEGQPKVTDAIAEGKTIFDVMREEGMRRYKFMEEEIRKNGEAWLKEEAEMIKKMEAEAMGEMKKGMFSWVPGLGQPAKPIGESSSGSA
jgi:mitochondrial import inner membrane translocase subunit TIM50